MAAETAKEAVALFQIDLSLSSADGRRATPLG
jgi:hypothetical protein